MPEHQPIFQPFDPGTECAIRERNLPHWFQAGAAIFVTFRTEDSLPKEVLLRMQQSLNQWLQGRSLPSEFVLELSDGWSRKYQDLCAALPAGERRKFRRHFDRVFQHTLDECHGRCLLKNPEIARLVRDAVLYGNGQQFDLDRLVIMPNHVHAIVQFRAGFDLSVVGQSWMRYTARKINKHLGQKGPFWQAEPFDHIIRSREQFCWLQNYVSDNPKKAKLSEGEYLLWTRPV